MKQSKSTRFQLFLCQAPPLRRHLLNHPRSAAAFHAPTPFPHVLPAFWGSLVAARDRRAVERCQPTRSWAAEEWDELAGDDHRESVLASRQLRPHRTPVQLHCSSAHARLQRGFTLSSDNTTLHGFQSVILLMQREHPMVFAAGTLRPGVEKETPNRQKKWAIPASAQGNAAFIYDK